MLSETGTRLGTTVFYSIFLQKERDMESKKATIIGTILGTTVGNLLGYPEGTYIRISEG